MDSNCCIHGRVLILNNVDVESNAFLSQFNIFRSITFLTCETITHNCQYFLDEVYSPTKSMSLVLMLDVQYFET